MEASCQKVPRSMSEVKQRAQNKWPSILSTLGVPDECLQNRHGPCPLCGGKDRFRFDDKDGKGGYYCNGCGAGDGFALLMKYNGWDFKQATAEVERIVGACDSSRQPKAVDPRKRLRAIQEKARAAGKGVTQYLSNRGLKTVAPNLMEGQVEYFEGGKRIDTFSAMLGKVVAVDGKPVTWHVTYLQDGTKAPVAYPKKIMKAIGTINGAAIRLYPQAAHIGVAEGIETAIAATESSGIPTWAVMNTNGMKLFEAPAGIEKITIFADNDAHYAGQCAAYILANRLALSGIAVDVRIPETPGDWLDVLND